VSAPASASGVRVLERETGPLHRRDIVDRDVVQVLRRERIHEESEPLPLENEIVLRRLIFDQQAVLESAAPAWLNAHTQSADIRRNAFDVHESLHLGRCHAGHSNGEIWLLSRAHFDTSSGLEIFDAWGLADRGLLKAGYRADLVLFDPARVRPAMPTVEADLPGGARRLVQKAEGIAATIVNGAVTLENGKPTGRLPGALLRGPGAAR